MLIHLIFAFRKYYNIHVDTNDTILTLKKVISHQTNIPICCLMIHYQSIDLISHLIDNNTLSAYGIGNNACLYISMYHNNEILCECNKESDLDFMLNKFDNFNIKCKDEAMQDN